MFMQEDPQGAIFIGLQYENAHVGNYRAKLFLKNAFDRRIIYLGQSSINLPSKVRFYGQQTSS